MIMIIIAITRSYICLLYVSGRANEIYRSIFMRLTEQPSSPNICLFKVNNRNTRKRCEISSKLTLKTPK